MHWLCIIQQRTQGSTRDASTRQFQLAALQLPVCHASSGSAASGPGPTMVVTVVVTVFAVVNAAVEPTATEVVHVVVVVLTFAAPRGLEAVPPQNGSYCGAPGNNSSGTCPSNHASDCNQWQPASNARCSLASHTPSTGTDLRRPMSLMKRSIDQSFNDVVDAHPPRGGL
eukprot:m.98992 g.98992  ORF g.98992 m.98992 type:complete len:170 (-) comp15311_c0_seq2:160-669(-)